MKIPFLQCNQKYTTDIDEYGYSVYPGVECGCNECEESCGDIEWANIIKQKSIFTGLNVNIVILLGFLIVVTIFANLWSYCKSKNKDDDSVNSRPSLDSYEYIKKDLIDK